MVIMRRRGMVEMRKKKRIKNDLRLFAMRVILAVLICNLILTVWKLLEVKLYGFYQHSVLDKYAASAISFLLSWILIRE